MEIINTFKQSIAKIFDGTTVFEKSFRGELKTSLLTGLRLHKV